MNQPDEKGVEAVVAFLAVVAGIVLIAVRALFFNY
jgi:hypothetical protein